MSNKSATGVRAAVSFCAAHVAGQLEQLEKSRGQGQSGRVQSLILSLRDGAEDLVHGLLPLKAARPFLRRMFRLGVFDTPPLSGLPYDAWRLVRADKEEFCPSSLSPFGQDAVLFSLLMPVYNPVPRFLDAALDSVRCQTWSSWELCVADDASTLPGVRAILARHAAEDPRIRVTFRAQNGHISEASNTALAMARGTWCGLMDHDDILARHALERVACTLADHPDAAVIFTDEDKLESVAEGEEKLSNPLLKPGFDPDLLLACNIVSHFGLYRTALMRELGGFRHGLEGAQDYDLALRCLAVAGSSAFVHLPDILYHWRMHPDSTAQGQNAKPYAREAALRARRDFLAQQASRSEKKNLSASSASAWSGKQGDAGNAEQINFEILSRQDTMFCRLSFTPPPSLNTASELQPLRHRAEHLQSENALEHPGSAGGATFSLLPGSGFADVHFVVPKPMPLLSLVVAPFEFFSAKVGGKNITSKTGVDPVADARKRADGLNRFVNLVTYAKREILLVVPDGDSPVVHMFRRQAERLAAGAGRGVRVVVALESATLTEALHSAVEVAQGGVLGLIRAGDVPLAQDWAQAVIGALWRDGVAVVGCRGVTEQGFLAQAGYAVGHVPKEGGARDRIEAWMCPAYAGLHVESAGYYTQAHLLHSVPAVFLSGFFCRRELFARAGGFNARMGSLAGADLCLRAYTLWGGRSIVVPGGDMMTNAPSMPEPADGAFGECWRDTLLASPPFQSSLLSWTPGGWKFRVD